MSDPASAQPPNPNPKPAKATPELLFAKLTELGIAYDNHRHAPVMTVEESRALRGPLPGFHAKNLFLKDKKGGLWLVVAVESRAIDLKVLRKRISAPSLSFGKPEALMEVLGVTPGSVTPFAVINDPDARVRVVLDDALANAAETNFHPLDNAQTTTISGADLLAFLGALDHPPLILDFTREDPSASS